MQGSHPTSLGQPCVSNILLIHAGGHQKSKSETAANIFYTVWLIHLFVMLVIAPKVIEYTKIEDLIFLALTLNTAHFIAFTLR